MKLAQIQDIWRAVRKSRANTVNRLSVGWSGIPRLTDGEIEIVRPLTLICGDNGAGKTSILHTIFHAVASEDHVAEFGDYCRPMVGVIVKAEVELNEQGATARTLSTLEDVRAHFSRAGEVPRVSLIDVGMHVPAVLDYMKGETNFADHLEGVDAAIFNTAQLAQVGFIVGRTYESIAVYELIDSSFSGPFPYFEASAQGVNYFAPDMGYGELGVMYIVWVLGRLEPGSLLLIEEPETFLSPRAQIALVDVIASYIKSKGFTVVMTSHSGPIAQRLQNSEIVYVTRASGQVVLHAPARTVDLVARLGLRSDRAFILFVEDVAGEIFARTLMNRYSDRLSGGVEYVRCNGESNVIRAIEAIPNDIRAVAHLGVLDGDQRAAKLDDPRILYLPSAVAPERLLRDFTATKTSDQLASYLGVSEADVSRALAHADGDELHNWPHTMSGSLNGMPHAEFMRRMFLAWSAENLGEVESFVRSVENFSAAT